MGKKWSPRQRHDFIKRMEMKLVRKMGIDKRAVA